MQPIERKRKKASICYDRLLVNIVANDGSVTPHAGSDLRAGGRGACLLRGPLVGQGLCGCGYVCINSTTGKWL